MGIVYASVNSAYFENIYGSVQSLNSVLFTLVRQDEPSVFAIPIRRAPRGGSFR